MRESTVEKYLSDRAKALGGEVRKVRWVGHNGAPDRLVLIPRSLERWQHPYKALVELKAPGKVPEPHQLREHARLRSYGFDVLVIDTKELVDFHFPLN